MLVAAVPLADAEQAAAVEVVAGDGAFAVAGDPGSPDVAGVVAQVAGEAALAKVSAVAGDQPAVLGDEVEGCVSVSKWTT